MIGSAQQPPGSNRPPSSASRGPRVASRLGLGSALLLAPVLAMALAGEAEAQAPVLLRTADSSGILAGSTITNTGPSVINGDLGLHPGTSVTGFPPGTVNGVQHVTDAFAQQAKTDLVTAYDDAAGRPLSATSPPDIGGQTLTAGVYRTGGVPSLGLTGNVTLNAQGNPNAVFIFQIASTLVTATDSSVSLINGAQACNVYWQVGSSATLGTRTAFKGSILALTSISVNDGVAVEGRLLARNGAVTLINDTITRSGCAAGTGPGTTPGAVPGQGPIPGVGPRRAPRLDFTSPAVRVIGLPRTRPPGAGTVCTTRDFTLRFRLRDSSGIRTASVYLDGKLVRRTSRTQFSQRIRVRGLRVGNHVITVVARDRAGNRSVIRRRFGRCALGVTAPRFTG